MVGIIGLMKSHKDHCGSLSKMGVQRHNSSQTNKDIVFSGGGTIDIKADIDLLVSSQVGGLVFKKKMASSSTTYTITSTGQ